MEHSELQEHTERVHSTMESTHSALSASSHRKLERSLHCCMSRKDRRKKAQKDRYRMSGELLEPLERVHCCEILICLFQILMKTFPGRNDRLPLETTLWSTPRCEDHQQMPADVFNEGQNTRKAANTIRRATCIRRLLGQITPVDSLSRSGKKTARCSISCVGFLG